MAAILSRPQCVNTGSGGIDIYLNKVNTWNVNCVGAAAFIFHTRMDVLMKVSKFSETENVSTWEGHGNYIYYEVWDEITYPFLNFNGATIEV